MSDNGHTAPVAVMVAWDRRVELARVVAAATTAEAQRLGIPIDVTTLALITDEIERQNRSTVEGAVTL